MKYLLCAMLAFWTLNAVAADRSAGDEPGSAPGVEATAAAAPAPEPGKAASAPLLPVPAGEDGKVTFYVIPIREQIGEPILFIVRNGVKDAIAANADCVVLDMNTPGGELGSTLEIMEILGKFDGTTVTYVNSDAISAGAFISAATDRIYFSPSGVIGAAAPVSGSGQDIDKTMHQKVVSYLRARVRAISEEHRYRGEVLSAMIDSDYELKIDDQVIKPKGGLLSLTASEAVKEYGDPPERLLGAGIVEDLPSLYQTLAGDAPTAVRQFEMTWSLDLAVWLMNLSPVLLAIGGLMLMVEIYTPGFGWVGGTGIALLLIVFFGHNVAGLSGHEPILFFILGVVLVLVEIFFFPGTLIFGGAGVLVILGSLLWGMADIWPAEVREVEGLSWSTFERPAYTLALGLLIGVGLFVVVLRFLPQTSVWNRMVLASEIRESAQGSQAAVASIIGAIGTVVSPLRPTGTIDINGQRFEASSELGEIAAGVQVRVIRRADFVLIVEPVTA